MIDCSNTVTFFKEKERLTNNCRISCLECPLNLRHNGNNIDCTTLIMSHTEKAIKILQKWSDENPIKTRKEDFQEKYPNHMKERHGRPVTCCKFLGYTDKCPTQVTNCSECWDMPV